MYVLVLAVAGWVNPTSATISAPRPSQAIHRPRARVVLLGLRCEIREQPDARVMQLGFLHDVVAVLPSSSVGEESLSPNHPDTSSRF